MTLNLLKVFGFRNLQDQEIEFKSGINLIWGDNGQGKTNTLEAIYLLGWRNSFRGASDKDLLKDERDGYYVSGLFFDTQKDSLLIEIGFERAGNKKVKLQRKEVQGKIELLLKVPMVIFHPGDLGLVQGEPYLRRSFLDGVFVRASSYHRIVMANFYRTLVQRNRLLKLIKNGERTREDILPWDREFIKWGNELSTLREKYLNFMEEWLKEVYPELHGTSMETEIKYLKSFIDEKLLDRIFQHEVKRGFSLVGPQVEDFSIFLEGKFARTQISQGEQKLLVLGIRCGEAIFLKGQGEIPLLLLDDGLASLDSVRQKAMLNRVLSFPQVIITHTEKVTGDFSSCHQIKRGVII